MKRSLKKVAVFWGEGYRRISRHIGRYFLIGKHKTRTKFRPFALGQGVPVKKQVFPLSQHVSEEPGQ